MKQTLRALFSPILNVFESGHEEYIYKKSHRNILYFIGLMFSGMSIAVFYVAQGQDPGYFLPVIIFGCIAFICFLVGILGTDRAVAKLWGSR